MAEEQRPWPVRRKATPNGRHGLMSSADKSKLDAYPAYSTAPTITDFTSAQHDHLDADDGGTLSAAAITSGNLDDDRLPAGGTDAAGWTYWYYAPNKKMYAKQFSATSAAAQDQLVADETAVPSGISNYSSLRRVGVTVEISAGGSRVVAQVRAGATATTMDVGASTTDGSNLDTKAATYTVDVVLRDA